MTWNIIIPVSLNALSEFGYRHGCVALGTALPVAWALNLFFDFYSQKNAITFRKVADTLAMDFLCLSAGLVGLPPLIASVITTSKKYIDSVRSARKSFGTLVGELAVLLFNVEILHDLLKGNSFQGSAVRFQKSSVLLACSAACETQLRSLCKRLGQEAEEKRSRFL